jgi:hypothetical protein
MYRSIIRAVMTLMMLTIASSAQEPPRPYVDPAFLNRVSKVSGFDSERVVRHFYLLKNGGAIEVAAKDPNDETTVKAVQAYLKKESDLLAKGNFENVNAIYGKLPDGTPQLKKMRDTVTFAAVPEENGGVLRLLTVNPQAKSAIHDYLRYQIDQFKTGDPTAPQD